MVGLLSLRESYPLVVYATAAVWHGLSERNVLFQTLQRFDGHTTWRQLHLGDSLAIADADGCDLGLSVTAEAIPGKRPLHLEIGSSTSPSPEDNVGLFVCGDGERVAYIPGARAVAPVDALLHKHRTQCLLFDGTFWRDDELQSLGLGTARALDMAHQPISGDGGSMHAFANPNLRRIYTHINNTNPILREDSVERRAVVDSGWEVAHDGMEIELHS